jgi:hypothetical protein
MRKTGTENFRVWVSLFTNDKFSIINFQSSAKAARPMRDLSGGWQQKNLKKISIGA